MALNKRGVKHYWTIVKFGIFSQDKRE